MSKKIITISREFGSGGRFIGEEIARKLGYQYYDKEIIAKVAKETGLAPDYIQKSAELSPKKGLFGYSFVARDVSGQSLGDYIHEEQRKIIMDLADREPCVIIGRNADFILRDRKDVINVFIHGNMPEKINRIKNLYNLDENAAKALIHDTDKRRAVNYNFYTEQKWGQASNYTLSLNSSELGYEKCEEIIIGCI